MGHDAEIISILNLLSAAVAFLISYYAYKNNRIIRSTLLRYISFGFLLIGVSLLLQAGTENIAGVTLLEVTRTRGTAALVAFLVYTALQLVAYFVFAWGYGLSHLRSRQVPPAVEGAASVAVPAVFAQLGTERLLAYVLFILSVYLASQAGIIILLLVIVYLGVLIFSRTRSNLALMVLFGFTLILVGHLLLFTSVLLLSSPVQLAGNFVEFAGFVALLIFLYWSGRVVR